MSIAELIMQGTNRASESTAWVGDSLAKLGQNVGAALVQKEQQKQAQAMLPMFQQSMQESMRLAGSGKTADAYARLMPFLTDPSVAQNPFMMPALEAGIKMNQVAADDYMRSEQLRIQEGMYNARYGGGGEPLQSGADAAEQAIMGEPNLIQPVNEMSGLPVMETPLTPEEQAAQLGAEGQPFKMQQPVMAGPTKEAAQAQKDFAQLPAYKQASVANVAGFNALPAQQKIQAANQSVAFDPGASKYEEAKIDLGEYGIDIVSIGVPKVNEQVRIKMTASGTNDDPTVRKTFAQDFVKVGEQQYKDNQAFISKVRESSAKLSKERPSADQPTFKEIFKQNGGILNATLAPAPQDKDSIEKSEFQFVLIPRQGATPIPITKPQYEMIQTIQTVPAIADSTGLNLSASKNIQKPTEEAQAPLSREEAVKKATEIKNREAKPTTPATPTTQPTAQFSPENPYTQSAENYTPPTPPRPAGRGASKESLELYRKNKEKELKDVQAKIDDIPNLTIGRKKATPIEKRDRFEELNQLKKEIESKLQLK